MSTYTQAWEQPEFCEDTAWRPHDRCNPQRIRNLAGRSKPFQLWRIEAVVCYPIAYAYCHVIPPPSLWLSPQALSCIGPPPLSPSSQLFALSTLEHCSYLPDFRHLPCRVHGSPAPLRHVRASRGRVPAASVASRRHPFANQRLPRARLGGCRRVESTDV
jgi:hypothetical protein